MMEYPTDFLPIFERFYYDKEIDIGSCARSTAGEGAEQASGDDFALKQAA